MPSNLTSPVPPQVGATASVAGGRANGARDTLSGVTGGPHEKVPPREGLERVLTGIAGEPLVILLTGHPDPDSIGGALAHERLVWNDPLKLELLTAQAATARSSSEPSVPQIL